MGQASNQKNKTDGIATPSGVNHEPRELSFLKTTNRRLRLLGVVCAAICLAVLAIIILALIVSLGWLWMGRGE